MFVSLAAHVRQVAELIYGLRALGCTRTKGEDQTMCFLSDSFDIMGNAADLQASGDLPEVDVVKVRMTKLSGAVACSGSGSKYDPASQGQI